MKWRHDVGNALIAENLAHHWFGRSSPDSYRAGPMSATEALGHKPTSTSDKHLRASMWFESVILLGVRELPVRQRLAKLSFSFWSALFFNRVCALIRNAG